MSHEIRTPINAILGMTDLALMAEDKNKLQEYLGVVKEAGDHLMQVINDILDISKIETGNIIIEKKKFSLRNLFNAIDRIYRHQIEKKELQFQIHIDENIPNMLMGDDFHIRQILINLLSNAIKFTEKGFIQIHVNSRKLDKSLECKYGVEIRIKDSGIGINKEKQTTIFEKFHQVDMSTKRKYGGSGLGLAIVQQLAQMMEGGIFVQSTENQGSEFIVWLALEKPTESTPVNVETMTQIASKSIIYRILLAEDNKVNQKLALTVLKKIGNQVEVAENGLEVLEILMKQSFDLILMDIEMPEMDGIEAAKQIREGHCGNDKQNILGEVRLMQNS